MKMDNVCRTCLRIKTNVEPLFENIELLSKIETIAPIQVEAHVDFPSQICMECIKNINKLYNFRKVIINSDKELRERQATLERTQQFPCKNPKGEVSEIRTETTQNDLDVKLEQKNNEAKEKTDDEQNISVDLVKIENHEASVEFNEPENDTNEDFDVYNTLDHVMDEQDDSLESLQQELNDILKNSTKKHECKDCGQIFTSRIRLSCHKRTRHIPKGVCNICGLAVRQDNLSRHVKNHSAEAVDCPECGRKFKNAESLRSHKYEHRGMIFTCEMCGRQFKTKSEYTRHMKSHADPNIRKVACKLCGKRVRELRKHMMTHTGERPYLCNYCKKGFTSGFALKVHTRQHTNENPYRCDFCDAAFHQKVSLVTHLKSKHNLLPS